MPNDPLISGNPRFITEAEVEGQILPDGGTTDQVLAKKTEADYDLKWANVVGAGGVLGPGSSTDGNLAVFDGTDGGTIKDGGAIPSASVLSANIARVDPSGDDGTGTVGDLAKPFLTFTAAVNAVVANQIAGSLYGGVVDIGVNNFQEDDIAIDTTDHTVNLTIVGANRNCLANSEHGWEITGTHGCIFYLLNCTTGYFETTVATFIYLDNADLDNVTTTATNTGENRPLIIGSYSNSGGGGMYSVIASETTDPPDVTIFGIIPYSGGSQITAAGLVRITNCKAAPDEVGPGYSSVFSVYDAVDVDGNLLVKATNSLLGDITSTDATFIDSRAQGSITVANGIDYQDVFLKAVPPGGTTGQALEKNSNDDFDTTWASLV